MEKKCNKNMESKQGINSSIAVHSKIWIDGENIDDNKATHIYSNLSVCRSFFSFIYLTPYTIGNVTLNAQFKKFNHLLAAKGNLLPRNKCN